MICVRKSNYSLKKKKEKKRKEKKKYLLSERGSFYIPLVFLLTELKLYQCCNVHRILCLGHQIFPCEREKWAIEIQIQTNQDIQV